MSQSTFEDDDLFDEAADDIRDDVEESLDAAYDALPESEDIWSVEADNTLGVLNSLRSGLDTGDAADHLRSAKKWYTMGKRAEVFDNGDDLEERIEALDDVISDVADAHERVKILTSTVPELRGALDDAHAEAGDNADATDETEAEAETAE